MGAIFQTREEAECFGATMMGWDDIRIVEEKPDPIGARVIYVTATDPISKRRAIFDGSAPQASFR